MGIDAFQKVREQIACCLLGANPKRPALSLHERVRFIHKRSEMLLRVKA